MTSRQHQDWLNHGKPDSGLALPLQLLANTLAAAGYTVYVYPNDAHLDAEPPEDHTYYSETGWPGNSPKWWRHAIDIMPPPAGRNLPSLQTLGQHIFDARQAGNITWLKYMNWPSDGNLNRAVHDKWEPGHSRSTSSDTGHIHLSSTTGCEVQDSSFNPLTGIVVVGAPGGGPAPHPGQLAVDGKLGPNTIRAWQEIMRTPVDGVITQPPGHSDLVAAVQRHLNAAIGAALVVDGQGIQQGGPWSHTTRALELYLGTTPDGVMSSPVSQVVKALQGRLNLGWF